MDLLLRMVDLNVFRRMRLHGVPPDVVLLQQLRVLDLSQNSIESIPKVCPVKP